MLTRSDDISVKFLKLILPEQGFFIAAIKNPRGRGFKPSIFASTIGELWTIIENADRDGDQNYFACASFKEELNDPPGTPYRDRRLGRTKHNVLGAKCFWLDIDVGPGKEFNNQDEALSAIRNFCEVLGLPDPIIVSSGSGLHVYWPLQQTLNRQTWEGYAAGLKNLCARHGLHADPTRTADISSVLRTPGTHNRKRGVVRLVECNPEFLDIEPYAIERFNIFVEHSDAEKATHAGDAPLSFLLPRECPLDLRRAKPPWVIEALRQTREVEFEPSGGFQIVEQCEQVRALRDSKGNLP